MADLARLEAALRKADKLAQAGDAQAAADAKKIADAIRAQRAAAPASGDRMSMLQAGAYGLAHVATLGLSDEIRAGVRGGIDALTSGVPFADAYQSRLAEGRGMLADARSDRPVATTVGEIAGALAIPVGGAARGATAAAQALRGGALAGATGAAYGFGAGEGGFESRARNAAVTGATSAAVGAAAPYAIRGVQGLLDGRRTARAVSAAAKGAPSVDELRTQSAALYDAARARGVSVKPAVVQNFADDVATTAAAEGIDPVLTPRAARAVKRISEMAQRGKIEWKDIELARRVTGIAAQSNDPNERRMAGIIAEKIDDFVLNLMDTDLDTGTAQGLGKEIAEARDLWRRMRGSERIAKAIEAANETASGFENGLRVEFRKLITDKKFFRSLSPEEQRAVREVARSTVTGTILRTVAGLSPGAGNRRNVLAALGGSAAGGAVAGPVGAIAAPALGYAAETAAGALKLGQAQRAQGLIAAGGLPQAVRPADLALLDNALRRMALPAGVSVNALSREPAPIR